MNSNPPNRSAAFSIVELLAAMAVFIGLMLLLVTATSQTGDMWRRSSSKIEQFQQARRGFESMTRRISQATLNTYWDYHYKMVNGRPDRSSMPDGYIRQSELRFRTGITEKLLTDIPDGKQRPTHAIFFQAPLGFVDDDLGQAAATGGSRKPLNNLLNTWGFYVEVNDDADMVPSFMSAIIPPRRRSRLMEMMEPSETFKMDNPSQTSDSQGNILTADPNWDNPKYLDWFLGPIRNNTPTHTTVRALSENVIALIILPKLTAQDEAARAAAVPPKTGMLCPVFDYDSKRLSNAENALNQPLLPASDPELNPKNQLPPVVMVTMVALDETSAARVVDQAIDIPGLINSNDLFKKANILEENNDTPEPGDGDLAKLEKKLVEKKLTYRIFTSNVGIRGAKWSRWTDK